MRSLGIGLVFKKIPAIAWAKVPLGKKAPRLGPSIGEATQLDASTTVTTADEFAIANENGDLGSIGSNRRIGNRSKALLVVNPERSTPKQN
jgi:hypothetical protein